MQQSCLQRVSLAGGREAVREAKILLTRCLHTSSAAANQWWGGVPLAPRDPILGVTEAYQADTNPDKINLGVGAYRDDAGQPWVLGSVREAERRVAGSHFMEYLPIGGLKDFVQASVALAYGSDSPAVAERRVAAVQSLSGTGSCRLFAEFQRRFLPHSTVFIPSPTWSNHHSIWRDAGVPQKAYRYYKPDTRGLDFEGLMEDVQAAPSGSVFLLHACAHNPTGVDPTPEQWQALSKLMLERSHFAFFDMAYQGFATGDCDRDAAAIRQFVADGHRVGLSQSFAKNMGLYGQRVGAFSMVCSDAGEAMRVESQMKLIARPMYSNPPQHGALLVSKILHDEDLKQQWFQEVAVMAGRIREMRVLLRTNLEQAGSPYAWRHITDQIGMFCYTGMTGDMVDRLAQQHSIYLTRNGRISMAGVNTGNVARLAEAIHSVTSDGWSAPEE